MTNRLNRITILVLFIAAAASIALGQSTAFNYQGTLDDQGAAANSTYDFEFRLFDMASAGTQLGPVVSSNGVEVTEGSFSVTLDFGDEFPGADRWIEIRVRQSSPSAGENLGGFTILTPRQQIRSAPYAIRSSSSANADTAATADFATNAGNATTADSATSANTANSATTAATADNALNLGGVAAGQYVVTTDPRLSDARTPTSGSPDYIQNGTTQQASSDFNISGTGKGDVFDAVTDYRIGGSRVLATSGTQNLFVGEGAGTSTTGGNNTFVGFNAGATTTSGQQNSFFGTEAGEFSNALFNSFFGYRAGRNSTSSNNSFFGYQAGRENTSGNSNSFFGHNAGVNNTTGRFNSFFGLGAGQLNTSGEENLFVGRSAGNSNVTGNSNTILGHDADVGSGSLNYATAIGSGAVVSTSNTIQLGRADGSDSVFIPGAVSTSGVISAATGFEIDGDRVLGIDGTNNLFVGQASGAANTTGSENTFVGKSAGAANTTGQDNSFFGAGAGASNVSGIRNSYFGTEAGLFVDTSDNSFFGAFAGRNGTLGAANSFFGSRAGEKTTTGSLNTFFGTSSGRENTQGNGNAFFGTSTGLNNTFGSNNSFIGYSAGALNTTGNSNSFVGESAGEMNTTGNENTFLGYLSGSTNQTGSFNLALGARAVVNGSILMNASAIGFRARVDTNDSLVLGSIDGVNGATATVKVGIGTTAPQNRLEVDGAIQVTGPRNSVSGSAVTISSESDYDLIQSWNNRPLALNGLGNRVGINKTDPSSTLEIGANSGTISFGGGGCPSGSVVVGFNGSLSGCNNYSIRGRNSTDLMLNRPTGGQVIFRENNGSAQLILHPGGEFEVRQLGSAGSTQLCRNGSNRIATCSSSIRYKNNVENFGAGADILRRLRPVTFAWKDTGVLDLGLVAEEVAEIEPLLVTYKNGVVEGVKYDRIGVVLVNVVKEQQKTIEVQGSKLKVQSDRIEQLESRLSTQDEKIEALKRLVCDDRTDAAVCQ